MSLTVPAIGLERQLGELADRLVRQEETTRRLEAALNVLVKLPVDGEKVDSALVRTPRTVLARTPPEFELPVKRSGGAAALAGLVGGDPADADVLWAAAGFVPDPLVGLDAAGRVRVWNPAAEAAFGWPAADVIGFPPPFVPDDKRAEEKQLLATACRGGAVRDVATVRRKRDGTLVRVRVAAAGHAGGAAFVVKPESAPPLRPALHAVVEKGDDADAAAGMKRVIAALVHDLNNLFTVVCGGSEVLIERHAAGDPRRDEAEMVHAAGVHAARLVRQLADLAADVPHTPVRADVNAVVREMAPVLRGVLGASRELVVETTTKSTVVAADPSRLSQVLLNLAANARDAMPAGGTVHVSTNLDDASRVVLTVRDTGPGVDPAVRAKMFDRNVSTKDPSRGIGLATVAEVVAQAGGRIAVESAPEQGTAILLILPQPGANDTERLPVG
jgi:PAS domain S-box-containing protein